MRLTLRKNTVEKVITFDNNIFLMITTIIILILLLDPKSTRMPALPFPVWQFTPVVLFCSKFVQGI